MLEGFYSLAVDLTTGRFSSIGVRELIILLVVLVVIYMLVVVLRIKSLTARRRFDEIAAARYEADLAEAKSKKKGKRGREPEMSLSTPVTPSKNDLDSFYEVAPRIEPRNKYAEPPDVTIASFDQEKLTRLERDLKATRDELDALRASFAQTRDGLLADIERLKAGQRVSPTYGDSLQMAMSGATAEEIAARCGIARAEAELVISLAKGSSAKPLGEVPEGMATQFGDDGKNGRSRYGSY